MMTQEELNRVPMYYLALTEEEKRETARNVLQSALSTDTKSVFFNSNTKQMIDIKDLTEKMGEEEVLDFIQKILESSSGRSSRLKSMSSEEMKDILTGKIVPDDQDVKEFLKALKEKAKESNADFLQDMNEDVKNKTRIVELITGVVDFSQNRLHYNLTNVDLLSSIYLLLTVSQVHNNASELSKFNQLSPEAVFSTFSKIGEDILAAWNEKCITPMNKELLVMGLLAAAVDLSFDDEQEIIPVKEIHDLTDDDNCDCENCNDESCICKTKSSDKE